jgi:hypothetical protein
MWAIERAGQGGLDMSDGRLSLRIADGEVLSLQACVRFPRAAVREFRVELKPDAVEIELWACLKDGREQLLLRGQGDRTDAERLLSALEAEDFRATFVVAAGPHMRSETPALPGGVTPEMAAIVSGRLGRPSDVQVVPISTTTLDEVREAMTLLSFVAVFLGGGALAFRIGVDRLGWLFGLGAMALWWRFSSRQRRAKRAIEFAGRDGLYLFPSSLVLVRGGRLRRCIARERVRGVRIDEDRWRVTLDFSSDDGPCEVDLSYVWRPKWSELSARVNAWSERR